MLSRHQPHELLVHDPDEGLARVRLFSTSCPTARSRPVEELTGDRQGDVRLEQGAPHFPQRFPDVVLGQARAAAEVSEGTREPLADGFEHAMILTRRFRSRSR